MAGGAGYEQQGKTWQCAEAALAACVHTLLSPVHRQKTVGYLSFLALAAACGGAVAASVAAQSTATAATNQREGRQAAVPVPAAVPAAAVPVVPAAGGTSASESNAVGKTAEEQEAEFLVIENAELRAEVEALRATVDAGRADLDALEAAVERGRAQLLEGSP